MAKQKYRKPEEKQQLREAAQEDQEEEHMRARLEVYHIVSHDQNYRCKCIQKGRDTRHARHLMQVISAAAGTLDQKLTRLTRMYQAVGFCLSRR